MISEVMLQAGKISLNQLGIQRVVINIGVRALATNLVPIGLNAARKFSSANKLNEIKSKVSKIAVLSGSVNGLGPVISLSFNGNNLNGINLIQTRQFHRFPLRARYEENKPNREGRWYDEDHHDKDKPISPNFEEDMMKFKQDMKNLKQRYFNEFNSNFTNYGPPPHHHNHHDRKISKVKVIGSVLGGIFVITHIPTLLTMALGGFLGVQAYKYFNYGGRRSVSPTTFNFQYPDTRSILKKSIYQPNKWAHFMENMNSNSKRVEHNKPPPSLQTLGWSVINQMFPQFSEKVGMMQSITDQLRITTIEKVQSHAIQEGSELNIHLKSLIKKNESDIDSDIKIDVNGLTFEPYGDVNYQSPTNKIHLEFMAKYPDVSRLQKVPKFLINCEGHFIIPPSSIPSVNTMLLSEPQIEVTKVIITCLQTWKSIKISLV